MTDYLLSILFFLVSTGIIYNLILIIVSLFYRDVYKKENIFKFVLLNIFVLITFNLANIRHLGNAEN